MCLKFWDKERAGDLDLAATCKFMVFTSGNIWKNYMRLPRRVCRLEKGTQDRGQGDRSPSYLECSLEGGARKGN